MFFNDHSKYVYIMLKSAVFYDTVNLKLKKCFRHILHIFIFYQKVNILLLRNIFLYFNYILMKSSKQKFQFFVQVNLN